MASILAPQLQPTVLKHADSNPIRHPCNFSRFNSASPRCPLSSLKKTELGLCCCGSPRSETPSSGDDGKRKSSESFFNGVVMGAVKRLEDCMNLLHKLSDRGARELGSVDVEKDGEALKGEDEEEEEEEEDEEDEEEEEEKDWDWRRWKEHFTEIEEQQWIASVLKMQLSDAVAREDYEAAVRLKMALHTAKESDTVGSAIHEYNKAIAQERYNDAAFLRDNAGAGLLGWWAGISNNHADVYGQIVNICAEHGRYVVKSYSSRQLAMSKPGSPLFEIYFTCGERGYKKQAVYLKRNTWHTPFISNKPIKRSARNLVENDSLVGEPSDKVSEDSKSIEKIDDDSDWINGLAGIKNMLRDVIPGVKFKAQNVIAPGKVDRDLISKDIEKITEEDEDNDEETPSSDDIKAESDMEENGMIDGVETSDKTQEQNEAPMKFVIGAILENMASDVPLNDLVRVPAELEIRNHLSFSFSVSKEDLQIEADAGHALQNKTVSQVLQRSSGHVRPDLSKFFASKEKMPIKVLVDIGELISLSMSQNQSHQLLVGTTHFNRIEIPATQDTLSGLYIGAHGMYVSEILHLKRRFGHWDEDDGTQKSDELEFYEYVEAYKLTGALSFPAGQVVFRAKVGKKNQLPHKGIIPEELNVLVRYRAQGRLADPGFQNPRWVDGELVILDGKNIRGGPVIGFVYWAPEHNFLVFFNRLRLPN